MRRAFTEELLQSSMDATVQNGNNDQMVSRVLSKDEGYAKKVTTRCRDVIRDASEKRFGGGDFFRKS